MKIIAIIQARMNSSRLPGKIMADICGKPLLQYVIDRVERSHVDAVVVACPEADWDKVKIEHRGYKVPVIVEFLPGDESDVAGRFAQVLERHPCDAFVRVCADSPLIDIEILKHMQDTAAQDMEKGEWYRICYGLCGIAERLATASFIQHLGRMGPYGREHVTTFWRCGARAYPPMGLPKLTVDTAEDLERVRGVVSRMTKPHTEYGNAECLLLA